VRYFEKVISFLLINWDIDSFLTKTLRLKIVENTNLSVSILSNFLVSSPLIAKSIELDTNYSLTFLLLLFVKNEQILDVILAVAKCPETICEAKAAENARQASCS